MSTGTSSTSVYDELSSTNSVPLQSFFVQALYPHSGADTSSLSFEQGDVIEVLSTLASGWWDGILCAQKIRGWFPSNYVQRMSERDAHQAREQMLAWWDGIDDDNRRMSAESLDPDDTEGFADQLSRGLLITGTGQLDDRPPNKLILDDFKDGLGEGHSDLSNGRVDIFGEIAAAAVDAQTTNSSDFVGGRLSNRSIPTSETTEMKSSEMSPFGGYRISLPLTESNDVKRWENGNSNVATTTDTTRRKSSIGSHSPSTLAAFTHSSGQRGVSDWERRGSAATKISINSQKSDNIAHEPISKASEELKQIPLLSDLVNEVISSLQRLLDIINSQSSDALYALESVDYDHRREELATSANELVYAVMILLHCTNALDWVFESGPANGNITGVRDESASKMGSSNLRFLSRKVTSILSKLLLSVRAIWGQMETRAEDQVLDEEDSLLPQESEEITRRSQLRQARIVQWAVSRETRFELQNKLRAEVIAGCQDLGRQITAFAIEYEHLSWPHPNTQDVLILKPKSSSLQISAAALLLHEDGYGYGANWRGNGFTSLPEAAQTTSQHLATELAIVSSPPHVPLTSDIAVKVQLSSRFLLSEIEASISFLTLKAADTSSQNSSLRLMNKTANLFKSLSEFLLQIEDLDIASSLDLSPNNETLLGHISEDGFDDLDSDTKKTFDLWREQYQQSTVKARPLLTEWELSKQSLYDVPADLLLALQPQDISQEDRSPEEKRNGAQPYSNSPLSMKTVPPKSSTDHTALMEQFKLLHSVIEDASDIVMSLAELAETQSKVVQMARVINPTTGKAPYVTGHSSWRNTPDARRPSLAPTVASSNASSSRQSLQLPSSENDNENLRGIPNSRSKDSTLTSSSEPSYDRRGSVETETSLRSEAKSEYRQTVLLRQQEDADDPTLSPSKSVSSQMSKLVKLLGSDVPESNSVRQTDLPGDPPQVPSWLGPDYGVDEVSFNIENQIKGGTLRSLVIAATNHESRVDSNYLSALLMTYRTFCTSRQLLDLLVDRFLIQAPADLSEEDLLTWKTRKQRIIRARVANVLKAWVREYMDHDEVDEQLLRRIQSFASSVMQDPVQSPQIIKAAEDRISGVATRHTGNLAPGPLPSSFIPRNFRKLKFTDIEPLELARQLTIMDGRLFARITVQDCLGKAWPKEYGVEAPTISAMIDMSNAVTRWVVETILAQEDLKKRANTIKHFVLVAERCLSLNNFSTLIHILAGLNSTPIHRLKRTWEGVNQKAMQSLATLNKVMRPDKNYKSYREKLRSVAPPCVPFLGVYLTDWTFIGDGNPDMLREKPHQINFNKRQKASELILMIKLHQSMTYNLAAVPVLAKFLEEGLFPNHANPATDDQRLYEISLAREPREREDEKIARLLSESGFL